MFGLPGIIFSQIKTKVNCTFCTRKPRNVLITSPNENFPPWNIFNWICLNKAYKSVDTVVELHLLLSCDLPFHFNDIFFFARSQKEFLFKALNRLFYILQKIWACQNKISLLCFHIKVEVLN